MVQTPRERVSDCDTANHICEVNTMTSEERNIILGRLRHMIARCQEKTSKSYKWYGAKGIDVCEEWRRDKNSFVEWADKNGFRKDLTIERYDTSKGYCPENCCFIPMSQQPLNTSRNVYIDYHGEALYISEVARREGVSPEAIRKRIKRGRYRVVDNPNRLRRNPTPSAEMP